MRTVAIGLMLLLSSPALADDYPTAPDDVDELCQEIGESPNASMPAKDRFWFADTCTCREPVGCGKVGSPRWERRVEVERAKEAKRQEAERKRQDAQRSAGLEQARDTCASFTRCLRGAGGKAGACDETEGVFEYECSAALRDVEACSRLIQAMKADPAKVDCSASFQ
jgi:hypothetical protein